MKIALYGGSNIVPIHARSIDERPLGGTETGLIRLSESLQRLGHEVIVFTPLEKIPASRPEFRPLSAVQSLGPVDVFISVRDWIPLLFQFIQPRLFLMWTGDSYDQYPNYGIGDLRIQAQIDGLLCVSDWQARVLCQKSGFPLQKTFVIHNGIHRPYFDGTEERVRKRLIYSSTPYRGLQYIPHLFSEILMRHPLADLQIYAGYKVYDQADPGDDDLKSELQSLPSCFLHGNILQKQLAREFMKSSILFYPSVFEETSCITAMEAMAAGCVPLTTSMGALAETIGDCGLVVKGHPSESSTQNALIEAADRLLTDDQLWTELSQKGRARISSLSWDAVAERLDLYLKERISRYHESPRKSLDS